MRLYHLVHLSYIMCEQFVNKWWAHSVLSLTAAALNTLIKAFSDRTQQVNRLIVETAPSVCIWLPSPLLPSLCWYVAPDYGPLCPLSLPGGLSSSFAPWWSETPLIGRWRPWTAVSLGSALQGGIYRRCQPLCLYLDLNFSSRRCVCLTQLLFQTIDCRLSVLLRFSFCLSEYQLAKPSDSHRKEMLFGSLAKPGHPMGKFCWGELVNTTAGTDNTHRASFGYVQRKQTVALRLRPSLLSRWYPYSLLYLS